DCDRPVPEADQPRRAAAAVERPQGRDEPGRAAPASLRRRRRLRRLAPPSPVDEARDHRAVADRGAHRGELRPVGREGSRIHRPMVVLARRPGHRRARPRPAPSGGTLMPANIAVIGCGHVGLVMAAGLAELGHHVVGVDRSEKLVGALCSGEVSLREEGLTDLVVRGLQNGRLTFTTSYDYAIPSADFILLAAGTHATQSGPADLRNIRAATRSIAGSLNGTSPIIVN